MPNLKLLDRWKNLTGDADGETEAWKQLWGHFEVDGRVIRPRPGITPTDDDLKAIVYLYQKWNYQWEPQALPEALRREPVGQVNWCQVPPVGHSYFEHSLSVVDSLLTAYRMLVTAYVWVDGATAGPSGGRPPAALWATPKMEIRLMRLPQSRFEKGEKSLDLVPHQVGIWPLYTCRTWPPGLGVSEETAFVVLGDQAAPVHVVGY